MKGFLATLKGKIILGVAAAVVAVAAVAVVMVVNSPKDYRSIKVEELSGKTTIVDGKSNTQDAYEGMNLESGDKVTVEADSNMTLLFDADKYMFADAGTKFTVEASGNSKKRNTRTKIVLEEGSVLCRIDEKLGDAETYEVETPNSVMSVRGTIFRMSIYKNEKGEKITKVDVLEGAVKVDLPGEEGKEGSLIEAGQAGVVYQNEDGSSVEVGDSTISYEDFSEPMAQFVVNTVDTGREICIGKDLFVHYTGLEDHPETATVIKEATCSAEGEQEIYCSTCDMIVRTEPVPKLAHTPGEWAVEDDAPCVERLRCNVCNEIIEERALDFELHDIERKTTDTKEGCNVHRVVEDVCQVCGMKQEVSVTDLEEHTYGDWEITTPATCLTAGVRQMVCAVCGDTETEEIEATGHSFGGWTTVTAATCTADGTQERICTVCGEKETQSIASAGHTYGSWTTVVAATCEEGGSESRTCSGCGNKETRQVAALGHDTPHVASKMHLVEGDYSNKNVGDKVDIFAYFNCARCGAEDILHMTGTITKLNGDYTPNFTCDICGANG